MTNNQPTAYFNDLWDASGAVQTAVIEAMRDGILKNLKNFSE
jgi:hypothetical protein